MIQQAQPAVNLSVGQSKHRAGDSQPAVEETNVTATGLTGQEAHRQAGKAPATSAAQTLSARPPVSAMRRCCAGGQPSDWGGDRQGAGHEGRGDADCHRRGGHRVPHLEPPGGQGAV